MARSVCLAVAFVAHFLLVGAQQTVSPDVRVRGPCDVNKQILSPHGDKVNPRCTSNGYFEHQQCAGLPTQSMTCWCANPFTGKAVPDSIKFPPERPSCSGCILAVTKAVEENFTSGRFVPVCLDSGDYAPLQCQGSVSNCWCVNQTTGMELPGTRATGSSPAPTCDQLSIPSRGTCLQKAAEATGRLGAFVPRCSPSGGHYRTMQCQGSSCFCVDPETGAEAPGTRILAWEGRNAPCGPCHQRKFEILESRGSQELPKCLPNGNFDDASFLRCKALNSTHSICNCLDEDGEEVPASRQIQTPTFRPTCPIPGVLADATAHSPTDLRTLATTASPLKPTVTFPPLRTTSAATFRFGLVTLPPSTDSIKKTTEVNVQKSIDSLPDTVTKPTNTLPVGRAECSLPKSVGNICANGQNKSMIQWYFDPATYECMAFRYHGCNGNANRFNTVNECWTRCKMPDAGSCAGQSAPAKGKNGTVIICHTPEECPTGYKCRMGAFFGSCCETKTEDLYMKNYRPTCQSGGQLVQMNGGGFDMNLLGKSCSDDFCPADSQCVQQEIFAHCCKLDGEKGPPTIDFQKDAVQVGVSGQLDPQATHLERDETQPMLTTPPLPSTRQQRSNSSLVPQSQQQTQQPQPQLQSQQPQSEYSSAETEPLPLLQHDIPSANVSSIVKAAEASIDLEAMHIKDAENVPTETSSGRRDFDCNAEKPKICEDGQLGWYLDKKVGSCVAAKFCSDPSKGNRFATLPSCEGSCYPADGSACYEDRPIIFLPLRPNPVQRPSCNDLSACPDGFVCKHGAFFGTCCNKTSEDIWQRNWQPTCANNQEVHLFAIPERDNYKQPLLGSNCDDKFCPKGTTCVQQEFFAHCCGAATGKTDTPLISLQQDAEIDVKPTPPEPEEVDWSAPDCTSVRDPGKCPPDSNQAPAQKFYFNVERGACMAFLYSGCGGNLNLFDTRKECLKNCQPADPPACIDGLAASPSAVPSSGSTCTALQCPDGFQCSTSGVSASCCNTTVTKLYQVAYDRLCPDGSMAGGVDNGDYFETTFAESCSDLKCDSGKECVQVNKYFAKCCGPAGAAQSDERSVMQPNGTSSTNTIATASAPPLVYNCTEPKDSGHCEPGKDGKEQQMYYYDPVWGSCFVFKYSGCGGGSNRFSSSDECQKACMPADLGPCSGPNSEGPGSGQSCENVTCTTGYKCRQGWASASCCNSTIDSFIEQGHAYQCPDGSQAGGIFDTENKYFKPTLAASCDDLMCRPDQKCVQVNKYFAKCCGGPVISTPVPFTAEPPAGVIRETEMQTVGISQDVIQTAPEDKDNADASEFPPRPNCTVPKDSGSCSNGQQGKEMQQFYYNEEWGMCFAFKYSGCGGNSNRFNTRSQCEMCKKADGSACQGPSGAHGTIVTGPNCQSTECPEGFLCKFGFGYAECCNATLQQETEGAYAYQCPDGRQASGIFDEYFQATFAQSCSDLICASDQECVQVSNNFAKCCGGAVITTPTPLSPPTPPDATPSSNDTTHNTFGSTRPQAAVKQLMQGDQPGSSDLTFGPAQILARRQNCSNEQAEAMMKCVEPLKNFIDSDVLMEIFPTKMQLEQLDETCAAYDAYKTCVAQSISQGGNCYLYEADMVGIMLGFHCQNDSRRILDANGACMEKVSEMPQARMCQKTFNSTIDENMQAQAVDGSSDLQYFCTALDKLLACIQPQLVQCSSEVAQYMSRRIDVIKTNVFKDCSTPVPPLDAPPTPGWPPMAGIGPVMALNGCPVGDVLATQKCAKDLLDDKTRQSIYDQDSQQLFVFTTQRLSKLPDFCEGVNTYKLCVSDITSKSEDCMKNLDNDPHYPVLHGVISHLCESENQAKMHQYGQCFTDVSGYANVTDCSKQLQGNSNSQASQLCSASKHLSSCMEIAVGETCGEDAMEFLHDITDMMLKNANNCGGAATDAPLTATASAHAPNCKIAKNTILTRSVPGDYIPQCNADGTYLTVQCSGLQGECWCVDSDGKELNGTRVPPGRTPTCGECNKLRQTAIDDMSDLIPQCQQDGSFQPIQCHTSNGSCWCVNSQSGAVIQGSIVGPGQKLPTCGIKEMFACEKQPWKEVCETAGKKPQPVFRYYKDGDTCKAYRYSYCADAAIVPPFPFKRKRDCEKHCLGMKLW